MGQSLERPKPIPLPLTSSCSCSCSCSCSFCLCLFCIPPLIRCSISSLYVRLGKDCFGETPKPTRETRGLPHSSITPVTYVTPLARVLLQGARCQSSLILCASPAFPCDADHISASFS